MDNFRNALIGNIEAENWYGAMTIALILPDICGSIEYPMEKSSSRYPKWFDKCVGDKYIANIDKVNHTFMTGNDCYALRCALLHEGTSNVASHSAHEYVSEKFILYHSKGIGMHCCSQKGKLVIDIPTFCLDISEGVLKWEREIESDKEKKDAIASLLKLYLPDKVHGSMLSSYIGGDLFA